VHRGLHLPRAEDILALIKRFHEHPNVSKPESFGLISRLASEQIQDNGETVVVELAEEHKGSVRCNPHDPDAPYDGHREDVGYHVQLTETCAPEKDVDNPKIITQVDVNLANTAIFRELLSDRATVNCFQLANINYYCFFCS